MSNFKPDWTLEPREVLAVALTLALSRSVPNWRGATDEQIDAVAGDLIDAIGAAWMRDVLRSRRRSLDQGELRSAYNDACDRLDVLASKLEA